jgi:hypothetical protein
MNEVFLRYNDMLRTVEKMFDEGERLDVMLSV